MSSRNNEASGVSVYSNQTYLASSGRTIDKDHVFTSKHKDEKIRSNNETATMSDWERRRYQQMKQRKRSSSAQRLKDQTEKSKGLRGKALQSIDPNSPKKPSNSPPKRKINNNKIIVHNDHIEVTPIKPPRGDRLIRAEGTVPNGQAPSHKPPKGMTQSIIDPRKNSQRKAIQIVEHGDATKAAEKDLTRYETTKEVKRGVIDVRHQHMSNSSTPSIINEQMDNDYREFFDYLKKEVSSDNGDLWNSFQILAGYGANELKSFPDIKPNVDSKRMKKMLGQVHHHLKSNNLFCKVSQIQNNNQSKKEHKSNDHVEETEAVRRTSKRKEGPKSWTRRELPDITGKTPLKEASSTIPSLPQSDPQPPVMIVMEKSNEHETKDSVQVRDTLTSTPDRLEPKRDQSCDGQSSIHKTFDGTENNASPQQTSCTQPYESVKTVIVAKKNVSPVRVSPFRSRTILIDTSECEDKYEQQDGTCNGERQKVPLTIQNECTMKDHSPLVILRPTPQPIKEEKPTSPEIPWKVKLRPVSKGIECNLSFTPKKTESFFQRQLKPTSFQPNPVIAVQDNVSFEDSDGVGLGDVIDLNKLPAREFPESNEVQIFPITNNSNNRSQIVLLSKMIILVASKQRKSSSSQHSSLANIIWYTKHSLIRSLNRTNISEVTIISTDGTTFPLLFATPQESISFFESWTQMSNFKPENEECANDGENNVDADNLEEKEDGKNADVCDMNTATNVHNSKVVEESAYSVLKNANIKEENVLVDEIRTTAVDKKGEDADQTTGITENSLKDSRPQSNMHLESSSTHTTDDHPGLSFSELNMDHNKEEERNSAVYKLSETEYEYVMLLRKMEENGMSREAILHRLDTENATDEIKNIVMDRNVQVQKSPKVKESDELSNAVANDHSTVKRLSEICQDKEGDVRNKLDNMFAPKTDPTQEIDSHVEKYRLMLKRGLHEDQVKHAMRRDGMKESFFSQVFCHDTSQVKSSFQEELSASSIVDALSTEEENLVSKYKMMLKIGLDKDQVRHKMTLDNIDERIVQNVCGHEEMQSPQNKNKLSSDEEEIASEYLKMLKYGLHEDQVRHKMTKDNIDRKIIDFVCKSTAKKVTPKRKRDSNLIRLHVETISNPNPNSVWSTAKKRKQSDDKVINICMLENLFKKKPMLPKQPAKATERKITVGLSGKTMQNVGVVLQKFKEFNSDELVGIIRDLDSKFQVHEENIELMTGLVPTDENDKMLLSNYSGEIDRLSPVEIFLLKLGTIPRAEEKIQAIQLMATFKQNCQNLSNRFDVLRNACDDVMKSDRLRDIMIIARDIGNKMNEGNYSGGAEGIKFSSLLKLSETKGNDGKTTVLDFIVARMIENGKHDTLNLVEDFPLCTEASRIFITDLVCEKSTLESARRVCKTEELMKREEESNSGKPFTKGLIKLGKFLKDTETDLDELEASRNKTKTACTDLVKFLCEDGDERAATQLLLTLKEFISHIERAVTKYHTLKAKARPKAVKNKSTLVPNKKITSSSAVTPMIVNQSTDFRTLSMNQNPESKESTPLLRPKFLFSDTPSHVSDSTLDNQQKGETKSIDTRSALMNSILSRRQDSDDDSEQDTDKEEHKKDMKKVKPVAMDARSALMNSILSRRQDSDDDSEQDTDKDEHKKDMKKVKPVAMDARSALMNSILSRRQDSDDESEKDTDKDEDEKDIKNVKPVAMDARSALMNSILSRRQDSDDDVEKDTDKEVHKDDIKTVKPVAMDARSALMNSILSRRQDSDDDVEKDTDKDEHKDDVKKEEPVAMDARSALMNSILARRKD